MVGLTGPKKGQPTTQAKPPAAKAKPVYIYGDMFRIQNSGLYQELLIACKRCGTRRLLPGGGYQRQFAIFGDHPNSCKNWSEPGYIQIIFAEKRLPTTAKIALWPSSKVKKARRVPWDNLDTFEFSGRAYPINENKGFRIESSPADGLGGVKSLIIRSEHTNHVVDGYALDIQAIYGGRGEAQTALTARIYKRQKRQVPQNPIGNCETYTSN